MKATFIIAILLLLSACSNKNDFPFPWTSKALYEGKEAAYHYASEATDYYNNVDDGKDTEIIYLGYFHVNKNGTVNFISKKKKEYAIFTRLVNKINAGEIYITRRDYNSAKTLGMRIDETKDRTFYKKGDPDFHAAIHFFLNERAPRPFFEEINGATRNLNPAFPKYKKNIFIMYPTASMYNEYTQKVSSMYIHGLSSETIPTTTSIYTANHPFIHPALADYIDVNKENKKVLRQGKEAAYHYAINDDTSKVTYIGYFYVNKNGDVTFISKNKEYAKFIEMANHINTQEISIHKSWYPAAKFIGMRINEEKNHTYYKKGDIDFQDAINMYLLRHMEGPFLREVGEVTRNLNPIFHKHAGYTVKTIIDENIYNHNGEKIRNVYIHGIDTKSLPTTYNIKTQSNDITKEKPKIDMEDSVDFKQTSFVEHTGNLLFSPDKQTYFVVGDGTTTIRPDLSQGLEDLNRDFIKAQEIAKNEKATLKVHVNKATISMIVDGLHKGMSVADEILQRLVNSGRMHSTTAEALKAYATLPPAERAKLSKVIKDVGSDSQSIYNFVKNIEQGKGIDYKSHEEDKKD